MVNLLTPQQKNAIAKEYKVRRSVVWFCALAFIAVSSLVLLLPSLLYVVNEYREVSKQLAVEKGRATQTVKGDDPVAVVKRMRLSLRFWRTFPPELR